MNFTRTGLYRHVTLTFWCRFGLLRPLVLVVADVPVAFSMRFLSWFVQKNYMHISVSRDGKTPEKMDLAQDVSLAALVKTMGLNDQTFFSKVNGKLVHPATMLKEGDSVEFVGIIYGG